MLSLKLIIKEVIQIGLVIVLTVLIVVLCPLFMTSSGGNNSLNSYSAKAASATSVNDIYVFSFSNKTGNDEIMFRSSMDGGSTFSNTVGFTNRTIPNPTNVEISADDKNIIISWSEGNVSGNQSLNNTLPNDGVTLGIVLLRLPNGTINTLN
jgi:uncharacterized protein (UPF0333 family)